MGSSRRRRDGLTIKRFFATDRSCLTGKCAFQDGGFMSRRRWQSVPRWWILGLILLGLSSAGTAQVITARLDGVVKDTTGGVLPKVKVIATHLGTNTSYEALTNEDGLYVLVKLPPGDYSLSAE